MVETRAQFEFESGICACRSRQGCAETVPEVLEGVLWILRSGARWQDLPDEFPHPSTCWRRLRDWEEQGVWLNLWRAFLSELNERQQLKWSESFLDGSFAPAEKGLRSWQNPPGERHEVDGDGRRRRCSFGRHSASPAEVKLAETTLATICVGRRRRPGRPRQKPQRVIADGGYDSDPLRERLARRGIELIAPHHRLVVRYDRSLTIYRGFFHIACRNNIFPG